MGYRSFSHAMEAFCTSLSATTRTAAASPTRPKSSQDGVLPQFAHPLARRDWADFGLYDGRAFSFGIFACVLSLLWLPSMTSDRKEREGERAGLWGERHAVRLYYLTSIDQARGTHPPIVRKGKGPNWGPPDVRRDCPPLTWRSTMTLNVEI